MALFVESDSTSSSPAAVCLCSMLIDAVELRCRGEKRSREEVLAAVPLRAVLSLYPGRHGWHSGNRNPPLMAGLVVPGRAEWATQPLGRARVPTIKTGALLVVGVQELRSRRNYQSFRQAWGCRVVGSSASNGAVGAHKLGAGQQLLDATIDCDGSTAAEVRRSPFP